MGRPFSCIPSRSRVWEDQVIAQVTAHTQAMHTHQPHALKLAVQGGGSKCASSRRSSRALQPRVKLHIAEHLKSENLSGSNTYVLRKGARESSVGCSRRRRKTDNRVKPYSLQAVELSVLSPRLRLEERSARPASCRARHEACRMPPHTGKPAASEGILYRHHIFC